MSVTSESVAADIKPKTIYGSDTKTSHAWLWKGQRTFDANGGAIHKQIHKSLTDISYYILIVTGENGQSGCFQLEGKLVIAIYRTGIACAMFTATCALSLPAQATLGERVSSAGSDQVRMHATAHGATSRIAYTVHLITLPSGTVVREYVAANGIVFGVAWEGPTLPNLKAALGEAFDQYAAATAMRRATPLAVSNDALVVFSGGHLRAFAGYAYLPQALPAGVDASVIQ
jgi:hypothetical protein